MGDLLIRGLDKRTLARLKSKASQSGRSLQSEAKAALQRQARMMTSEEIRSKVDLWRKQLNHRKFPDSAAIIRRDRGR